MLSTLGSFVVRRRRLILVAGVIVFVLSGALGGGVAKELSTGGFQDDSAESTKAEDYLLAHFQASGTPNIVLVVSADAGTTVDSPDVVNAGTALTQELAGEPRMAYVASYWTAGSPPPLRTPDGHRALVFARFDGEGNALTDAAKSIVERFTRHAGGIQVQVGGFGPIFQEVGSTIEHDLVTAELIAFPITLILLLLVFRGAVAAVLPLAIGGLSIVGTFLVLLLLNKVTEVSVFSLNLTTGMGLGLAIDYSLFIVSRYREEMAAGYEPDVAVVRTVRTAAKTVAFSALTVSASLCALLVFPMSFLRSFAYAGCAVSLLAGLYAVVVLPAMLAALGHRIDALSLVRRPQKPTEEGFWHGMAVRVMRRPVPFATGAIVLLLVLGSPALKMTLGLPDDRVLPASKASRQVSDIIRNEFTSEEAGALAVIAPGTDAGANAQQIEAYATQLAALPGVARVDAATGSYLPGGAAVPAATNPTLYLRFVGTDATYLNVVPSVEPLSEQGEDLVKAVRHTAAPFKIQVGGQSANLVDTKDALFSRLPLAAALIALITFALLFMMFGSVVVPLKALVLNLLSLTATFGAMVWIFQEGHLSGFFNFTATGFLDSTTPILMFCVAFGLSMDYEVFLLSRIKEEHDGGAGNVQAVAVGLERTGRIVTAAAILISIVFLSFATSEVTFIKLFGVGLSLAVLMDAFVIRGTLVPAFMRLAGEANWWAPAPLRRFHNRFGISEHVDLEGPAEPAPEPSAIPEPEPVAPVAAEPEPVAHNGTTEPRNGAAPRRRTRPLVAAGRDKMPE
jgi:RND superfamily putative drug exporter